MGKDREAASTGCVYDEDAITGDGTVHLVMNLMLPHPRDKGWNLC